MLITLLTTFVSALVIGLTEVIEGGIVSIVYVVVCVGD
jgi:uncharacterized YccA/Bax inhibitor family protein